MNALVVERDHLKLQELSAKPLSGSEARVRVRAVGICATDLPILSGRITFGSSPRVLGHEIAGVVDEVGDDVSPDWIGRRVIVDPVIGCNVCSWCRTGRKLLCKDGGELGTSGGDGGYAEFVTVPIVNLYTLPDQLSFEEGALMEPLNCIYGALKKACPTPGESVLIFGSGPAGLLFLELAGAFGCSPILMSGGGPLRLGLARNLGATDAWDYQISDLADKVRRATGGLGPDIAIEASGTDVAVQQAFELVKPGGRVVLYGISGAGTPNIPSDLIVSKDLTVVTGIGSPLLWEDVIAMAGSGRIDLHSLITHKFSLNDFERALAIAADVNQSAKVVFCP